MVKGEGQIVHQKAIVLLPEWGGGGGGVGRKYRNICEGTGARRACMTPDATHW